MEIAGLAIGVIGALVSLLAAYYSAVAARRSEQLLRRLVIYPFRELDIAFARLNSIEQEILMGFFRVHNGFPESGITGESSSSATDGAVLRFLMTQGWLVEDVPQGYRINPDRVPYLTFTAEAEKSE